MKIVLKLAPGFLRRFDEYLRLNHPWLWATRIHINLYISVFAFTLAVAIGFLIPVETGDVTSVFYMGDIVRILSIPTIAWFILLFRQMTLYNVDKSHGQQATYREFLVFVVYIISFALPLTFPATATYIVESRISQLEVSSSIQTGLVFGGEFSWNGVIIIGFFVALLFSIFRQVPRKNFFLNFAFVGGIIFLLGIFSAFFRSGEVIMHGILVITILLIVYCSIMYPAKRNGFLVYQAFILLNIVMPMAGMILLFYINKINGNAMDLFSDNSWSYTFWGGLIVYTFLWNTLFKKAYLRLWNLPQAN